MKEKHVRVLENIKRGLCIRPRLGHLNLGRPFVLYTNASKIALDAVLLKLNSNGIERAASIVMKNILFAKQILLNN